MAIDSITITEQDNQLGTTPANTEDMMFAVGVCSSTDFPINTPSIFSSPKDARAQLVGGPLCEWVCFALENFGNPVLVAAAAPTDDGSLGSLDITGVGGTCVPSIDSSYKPVDDYQVVVTIVDDGNDGNGTTVGTAGIRYRVSLDDGRTPGRLTELGTANAIIVTDANIRFPLAAGTLKTGDTWTAIATAPAADDSSISDALDPLKATLTHWTMGYVDGIMTPARAALCETFAAAVIALGHEEVEIMGSWRLKNAGETEQAYLTAWQAAWSNTVARHVTVFTDGAFAQSPISQRRYRRRAGFAVSAFAAAQKPGQDLAAKRIGPLPASVSIVDDRGNPAFHDERTSPGLDDARASTLRSRVGSPGAFIGNARLLTALGSDFEFWQHGRVMDKGKAIVRRVLDEYSSDGLLVDKGTGFILEEEAADIDENVNHALQDELTDKGDVSGAQFRLNRTDPVLSIKKLRGPLKVIPLFYVKEIEAEASFFNPALKARTNDEEEG
jgi:hypothetical protein